MNLNFSNNDLLINKYFIAFSTNFEVFQFCPCQMCFRKIPNFLSGNPYTKISQVQ